MDHCQNGHPYQLLQAEVCNQVACSPESLVHHSPSISSVPHPTRRTSCAPTMDALVGQPRRGYTGYADWQAMQTPIVKADNHRHQEHETLQGSCQVLDTHRCKST